MAGHRTSARGAWFDEHIVLLVPCVSADATCRHFQVNFCCLRRSCATGYCSNTKPTLAKYIYQHSTCSPTRSEVDAGCCRTYGSAASKRRRLPTHAAHDLNKQRKSHHLMGELSFRNCLAGRSAVMGAFKCFSYKP